jgi:hypothetical protein
VAGSGILSDYFSKQLEKNCPIMFAARIANLPGKRNFPSAKGNLSLKDSGASKKGGFVFKISLYPIHFICGIGQIED